MFAVDASVSALWRSRCSTYARDCLLQLANREGGKLVAEFVLEQRQLPARCGGRGWRWQQLLRE
jgi:hypothetical protein